MTDRPLRVVVRVPGTHPPEQVELHAGEQLIVGRDPDWRSVEGAPVEGRRALALPSPSVSANHVLVRREADRVCAVDLGSRNGTWMALPARVEVVTHDAANSIELSLAPSSSSATDGDMPSPASWTNRAEFLDSIAASIAGWLEAKDLVARVWISEHEASASAAVRRMPVALGVDVMLEPLRTVDASWLETVARVERFVSRQRLLFETEETMRAEGLVVASPAMRRAVERVIAAAAHGARALLLTGPSGAGKEGLARCFHRNTARQGPFVARNCAMFNKELVRAELFGAEKGAFTGSVRRIAGAVESADEGTLFLDELGELPREVQPMLLRFLDHGEYERLGGDGKTNIADVRIVAATNRDLRAASLDDLFRRDLWFRLSVHVVDVPPLRERPEDVLAYLRSQTLAGGRTLLEVLTPGALQVLTRHDWQGNFRELVNFAERTRVLATHGPIATEVVLRSLEEGALQPLGGSPIVDSAPPVAGDVVASAMERARAAFGEDHGGAMPRTWDQVKRLVESYLKPILFAELTQSTAAAEFVAVDQKLAADRVRADRGTAKKQLRRYFDRFGSDEGRRK